jgi:hypothetical protein
MSCTVVQIHVLLFDKFDFKAHCIVFVLEILNHPPHL